jgi:hypothetical protein
LRHDGARLLFHGRIASEFGSLFGRLMFQHIPVDGVQQLSLGDGLALLKRDSLNLSGDARFHLNAVYRLDISHF